MEHKEKKTEYATGQVAPPKSHRGLITLLLILVILLGGLVSLLGFANIQLSRLLENTEKTDFAFVAREEGPVCRKLSDFDRQYYGLPQGIYVGKPMGGQVRCGDVVIAIDGVCPTAPEQVEEALRRGKGKLRLYREGKTLEVILEGRD